MTQHHRTPAYVFLALLVLIVTGCTSSKSQLLRTSFLPPAPAAGSESDILLTTPPPVTNVYAKEQPNPVLSLAAPPRLTETERRILQAQEHFDAGKIAYDDGRIDEARREFNRAVDILLATPGNATDRARVERRLEQIIDAVYRYDVNGMGSGEDWDKVVYDKSPLDDGILQLTFPVDPRLKSKVKEELQATVSQLPLEENDSVLAYIHYFTSEKGRKSILAGLRRSGRYKPMVQRILAEESVPQELIFLAQAESGFLPRAVSYKKAAGMWQFDSWRGREYGLNQSSFHDERLDPEKATRAAARHLRDLYNQFGDWYLAMAAYNCGPGCVDKAVQRTGYADFWTLREKGVLPRETCNYVPLILAMTIMAKNPKDYDLDDLEPEGPLDYETVKLEAPTSVALLADAAERPISEIRELNPALLRATAPAGYEVHMPKGTAATVASALNSIPANRRATWRVHRVGAGETLATIAKRYRTAPSSIADVNPSFVNSPTAGELLIIPASYNEDARTVSKKRAKGRTASASHRRGKTTRVASSEGAQKSNKAAYQRSASIKTASLRRISSTR